MEDKESPPFEVPVVRTIILIGLTGNGKSSLVKQILEYAGYNEEAKKIHIGDGNVSETQRCSSHTINFPIKHHFLQRADVDQREKCRIKPDEDTDPKEVIEGDEITKRSILLNIIDTPGFSDSSNLKERETKEVGKDQTNTQNRTDGKAQAHGLSSADERHKIGILLSMMKARTVHATCFVVRKSSNYGQALQSMIRNLVAVFDLSFGSHASQINYHILHTEIDPADRWSNLPAIRKRDFKVVSNIRATHHFLDNLPSKTDSIACYLAKFHLAGFFLSLFQAKALHVAGLKYPKLPEHSRNDNNLGQAMRRVVRSYEDERHYLDKDLSRKVEEADAKSLHSGILKERLAKNTAQLSSFTSSELVEVSRGHFTTEASWWQTSSHPWTVDSLYPISKVETVAEGGQWHTIIQKQLEATGTLEADWFKEAKGTLILYSEKRALHQEEIQKLEEEDDALMERIIPITDSINSIRNEKIAIEKEIATRQRACHDLRRALSRIAPSTIEVDSKSAGSVAVHRVKYFAAQSALAASKGYGFALSIPKNKLPNNKMHNPTVLADLDARVVEKRERLQVRQVALPTLDAHIQIKEHLLESLKAMHDRSSQQLTDQQSRTNGLKVSTFLDLTRDNAAPEDVRMELGKVQKALVARVRDATREARSAMAEEERHLKEQREIFGEAHDGIQDIVIDMKKVRREWAIEIRELELWIEAGDLTRSTILEDTLELGAFAVVMAAIESAKVNPYLDLWGDTWEVLKLRDVEL